MRAVNTVIKERRETKTGMNIKYQANFFIKAWESLSHLSQCENDQVISLSQDHLKDTDNKSCSHSQFRFTNQSLHGFILWTGHRMSMHTPHKKVSTPTTDTVTCLLSGNSILYSFHLWSVFLLKLPDCIVAKVIALASNQSALSLQTTYCKVWC